MSIPILIPTFSLVVVGMSQSAFVHLWAGEVTFWALYLLVAILWAVEASIQALYLLGTVLWGGEILLQRLCVVVTMP